MRENLRKILRVQIKPLHSLQGYGRAVIILYNLRLDPCTGSIGRSIHVSYETHGRNILVGTIGWNMSHYIAILIQTGLNSHLLKFVP